ncbi:MAG: hypothetical protein NTU44_15650 [Bacteroidetes bacterium]|nr:hypothetical protein [Bacteroidota bacterium]
MKAMALEIKPKQGLGDVKFGDTMETLFGYLGQPEDMEELEDADEFPTLVLNYWDEKITVFVEGIEKQVISCFEVDNDQSILFGKWAFNLKEEEITALMTANGYTLMDVGLEEWGEKRLTFEDGMIDFFFDKEGNLLSINWGVLVNDKGEIEEL